jgi:Tol biopolymer transport system component
VARFLWRAKVDSQRPPERLDLAGVHASYPAVARTGNRLAFSREQTNYDIWRYKSDGALEPFITSSLVEQNPQFSPDGSRVAVASGRSGDRSEIWVVNADGSRPVQPTSRLGRYQGTPRWSPDGRWIAFDSLGQDVQWDIWIVEANGGRPRRITSEPSNESAPAWSRDGNWIYFRSDRTGSRDIWRVPFAGGRADQITQNGGHIALESPDGKDLYYVKSDSSPLFVVPLKGGTERQVLDGVVNRGFVVLEDGIYYVGRPEAHLYSLQFFQFSTGQSRLLTRIEGPLFLGLTVSPDRKTWLFSRSVASGSDLMLIENFR